MEQETAVGYFKVFTVESVAHVVDFDTFDGPPRERGVRQITQWIYPFFASTKSIAYAAAVMKAAEVRGRLGDGAYVQPCTPVVDVSHAYAFRVSLPAT